MADPITPGNPAGTNLGPPEHFSHLSGPLPGTDPPPPEHLGMDFVEVKKVYVKMPPTRAINPRLVIGGIAGLVLALGLLVSLHFVPSAHGSPTADLPAVVAPNAVSPVVPPATPACALKFLRTFDLDSIPDTGPVNVQWSSQPGAASYAFKVIPPASFSVPWLFPTDGNSRTIYMENFAAGGDYQFTVDALDAKGGVLCSAALKFSKSAYNPPSGKKGEKGGACTTTGMMVICP